MGSSFSIPTLGVSSAPGRSCLSRHHAKIAVTPDGVSIADLGSKNGTLVGRTRVKEPVALRDGDRIRLGSARLTHRARSADRSTVTERSEDSPAWTRRYQSPRTMQLGVKFTF